MTAGILHTLGGLGLFLLGIIVMTSGLRGLAGFDLVFVGIGEMQAGMKGLEHLVTPDSFPGDTWIGRLQLVAIGVGITIVTQSSSAGVATPGK